MDTIEVVEKKYPLITGNVDGRTVNNTVPNMNSISSSLNDYTILKGIREINLSEFDTTPPKYYSTTEEIRTKKLAEQIKQSNQISPLIVVIDKDGPYILEGGHRFDALKELHAKSFPAIIVVDNEQVVNESLKQKLKTIFGN